MKISFIEPKFFSTWECLGIAYIASYLKKHYKGDLDLKFFQAFFDDDKKIVEGSSDSDIVAFSCTSPTFQHGVALATKIKEVNPKAWIVFGGWHVTAIQLEALKHKCINQIVVGEGEKSFLKVVRGSRAYVVYTAPFANLDELPFPDRELIRNERLIALTEKNDGKRITSVLSSRGCPFRCICCAEYSMTGGNVRVRSPRNVLDEINQIVERYNIDFLKFRDPTFNSSIGKVENFCRAKIKEKTIADLPWGCNIHASIASPDMFKLMKRAGCREIWVGVESGSPRILKEIRKGITVQQIKKVFKWSKETGLLRRAYAMLGAPSENFIDVMMTKDLLEEIQPDSVGFTIMAPYPGTVFYDKYRELVIDWEHVDEYQNPYTKTAYLSNEDLQYLQKRLVNFFKDKLVWRHRVKC